MAHVLCQRPFRLISGWAFGFSPAVVFMKDARTEARTKEDRVHGMRLAYPFYASFLTFGGR